MIRTIDLKNYLPPYILEYKELNEILSIENKHIQGVEDTHWNMIDNRYIETCDLSGIARFEKLLSVTPLDDDTLEDRKMRILSKWNKVLPYNYSYLDSQLNQLCGSHYKIELNGLNLMIYVGLSSKNMFNDAKELVDKIIPCNVAWEIMLLYNTHKLLSMYPNYVLKQFNHNELRNEELTDLLSSSCERMADYTCDEIASSWYTCDSLLTYGIRKKVENE